MDSIINYLLTLYDGDITIQCALQVDRSDLTGDCAEFPMEPENRAQLHALLPADVQSVGPVVSVVEISYVHIDARVR